MANENNVNVLLASTGFNSLDMEQNVGIGWTKPKHGTQPTG